MRKRARRKRARRLEDEKRHEPPGESGVARSADQRLGAFYSAGPAMTLRAAREEETLSQVGQPGPVAQGEGTREHVTAFNNPGSLRLEGRTDADFDGGSFRTERTRVRPASTCEGCTGGDCVHVTGVLVSTYHVTTRVTLPSVADYPDLTPCQRGRVQNAIDTVLAPHEQEHVHAFRGYNGTTRRPFDLTLCRSEFDSAIRSMFEAEEAARRRAAQQASDDLDPFHFDVDLNCED